MSFYISLPCIFHKQSLSAIILAIVILISSLNTVPDMSNKWIFIYMLEPKSCPVLQIHGNFPNIHHIVPYSFSGKPVTTRPNLAWYCFFPRFLTKYTLYQNRVCILKQQEWSLFNYSVSLLSKIGGKQSWIAYLLSSHFSHVKLRLNILSHLGSDYQVCHWTTECSIVLLCLWQVPSAVKPLLLHIKQWIHYLVACIITQVYFFLALVKRRSGGVGNP